MRILKIEINTNIEIVEYGNFGRRILKHLGIFDSFRQAEKAIRENFNVRQIDDVTFERLESEE